VIADIRELQQAFDDAELHAGTGRLNSLLADDFISTGERGFQLDKRQWIARHADFAYLSLETPNWTCAATTTPRSCAVPSAARLPGVVT
jgi:hypothetical protein